MHTITPVFPEGLGRGVPMYTHSSPVHVGSLKYKREHKQLISPIYFDQKLQKARTKFTRASYVLSLRQKTTTTWESTPNTCLFIHFELKYKKGMHKEVPILLARVSSQFLSSSHYVEQKWTKQSNAASDTWRSENETWYPGTRHLYSKFNSSYFKIKYRTPCWNQYEE